MNGLHANSLTIPSMDLPGYFGSKVLATEFRQDVTPVVNRPKCVLYEREACRDWFHRKYLAPKKPTK